MPYYDDRGNYRLTGITSFYGETILRDDEILCPICNGNGTDINNRYSYCRPCDGNGKVDWVKYVILKGVI